MKTTRRGFLSSLVVASAIRVGLRADDATQGVPRALDCRKGDVIRCGPDGQVAVVDDTIATVRLHGGVDARWIPKART